MDLEIIIEEFDPVKLGTGFGKFIVCKKDGETGKLFAYAHEKDWDIKLNYHIADLYNIDRANIMGGAEYSMERSGGKYELKFFGSSTFYGGLPEEVFAEFVKVLRVHFDYFDYGASEKREYDEMFKTQTKSWEKKRDEVVLQRDGLRTEYDGSSVIAQKTFDKKCGSLWNQFWAWTKNVSVEEYVKLKNPALFPEELKLVEIPSEPENSFEPYLNADRMIILDSSVHKPFPEKHVKRWEAFFEEM